MKTRDFKMKFSDIINLNEVSGRSYEYGCVMLYFNFPDIKKIYDLIDDDDVYIDPEDSSFGIEDEPHTTLLFGLHKEVTLDDVKKVLGKFTYSECTLHNVSIFENDKYDVLKFDVDGNNLHETNDELKKYPYTSDYPDYHPHLTIAYLKKGKGNEYVGKLKKLGSFELTPTHSVYSESDGTKTKIKIEVE
jgi:2'-5' RNA ligase